MIGFAGTEALGNIPYPNKDEIEQLKAVACKRGRPVGSTKPDTRRHKFAILLNDKEKTAISANAARYGMTISAYIRHRTGMDEVE